MSAKSTPQMAPEQLEHPSSQMSQKMTPKDMPSMNSVFDNDCCRITKVMLNPGECRMQEKHTCNYCVYIIQPARLCFTKEDGGEEICQLDCKAGTCYNMVVCEGECKCSEDCVYNKDSKGKNISLPLSYCVKNCGDTVYECIHVDMKNACNM